MPGLGKKPAEYASRDFARLFGTLSKAALIDALWAACQLGTDTSEGQITAQAARNALIVLTGRGDRIHPRIQIVGAMRIDSDGEAE